eukprot:7820182-Alexandrium_andersonii.AAC.1
MCIRDRPRAKACGSARGAPMASAMPGKARNGREAGPHGRGQQAGQARARTARREAARRSGGERRGRRREPD